MFKEESFETSSDGEAAVPMEERLDTIPTICSYISRNLPLHDLKLDHFMWPHCNIMDIINLFSTQEHDAANIVALG